MFDTIWKWVKSKLLYPVIFGILVLLNNSVFNGFLSEETLTEIAMAIIALILGETIQQIKTKNKK